MDRERPSIEQRAPQNPMLETEGALLPKKYSLAFVGTAGVGKSLMISNIHQSRGISSKATVTIGTKESGVHGTIVTTVIPTTKHSFIIDTMGISGFQKSDDIHNWWQLNGNEIREVLYNPKQLKEKLKHQNRIVPPHPQLVVFISNANYYLPKQEMEINAKGQEEIDEIIKKKELLKILITEWKEKTNFVHNAIVVLTHADQLTPEQRERVLQHAPKAIGLERSLIKLVSNVDVDKKEEEGEENNFLGPKRIDNLLEECFDIIDVNLKPTHKNDLHIVSAWFSLTKYPKYKKDVTEKARSLVKKDTLHLNPATFFSPVKEFGEFDCKMSSWYGKSLHVKYYYRGKFLEKQSPLSEGFHIP